MLFQNLKIKTKIFLGFLVILAFTVAIGFFSGISIININDRNNAVHESTIAPLETLMKVEVAFANVRQTSRGFIIRIISDPTQLAKQDERLRGLLDTMTASVDTYIQTLTDSGSSSDIISKSVNVKAMYEKDFRPMIEQMMEIAKSGDITETVALLDSTNDVSTQIYNDIQAIYQLTLDEMSTAANDNSNAANRSVTITIAFIFISLIISLILATIVSGSVSKPVKRLIDMTENLARGDLNINKMKETKDEIGVLVSHFYTVVDTLKLLIDDMSTMSMHHNAGDIDEKIDSAKFDGVYRDVATGVNEMVFSYIGTVKECIGLLDSISKGQFEVHIQQYPGKKAILNRVIENIKASLKGISEEINVLADAAGNGELSRRGSVDKYNGDWAEMLRKLNVLLDNVIAPIKESSDVLSQIAKGNLDAKIVGDYPGDFAIIKASLNGMSETVSSYIKELSTVLGNISNNDLDQEIKREYVGQFNSMKTSVNQIIKRLNSIMGEIGKVSEQVLSGSKMTSENSMMFAQGAAEQAGAIEELTATIDSLNRQTQSNAQNAKTANELSQASKQDASAGNEEMKQMLMSMTGIKESSNNISKIIKVIEDIAFQTNLLALNAAVEAARAGQHGKGFAVVAEEVRSLASRSQNAAKETNDLINDSIARVDEGTRVATNTAASLDAIVSNFEQLSELIRDIANASEGQATAISEVGSGLDQISRVIHTSTATSQESASASQELASQSEVLRNMISSFKLKS